MYRISKLTGLALVFFSICCAMTGYSLAETPCGGVEAVPPFADANQEIRIADVAFSVSMNGHCPSKRLADGIRKPGTLYFWMRLEGGPAALEKLKLEGRLPIRHRWVAKVGSRSSLDGWEDIPATDTMGRDLLPLTDEETSLSYFDWRTKTRKERIFRNSSYRIEILDAQDRPIPCAANLGCLPCADEIPCAVKMKIR